MFHRAELSLCFKEGVSGNIIKDSEVVPLPIQPFSLSKRYGSAENIIERSR